MKQVFRLIHIQTVEGSQPGESKYNVFNTGRHGEEAGVGDVEWSLSSDALADWLAREGFSYRSVQNILDELVEKGSVQREAPPRIGPRIVRAWFDTVLNPLIEFVELEMGLLGNRNWTYSFGARTLELIQPVKQRFDNANFEQVLQMTGELEAAIDRHDGVVVRLQDAVITLHDTLVSNPEFVQTCESLLSAESLHELGVRDRSDIFGAYPPSEHYNLIAGYVVNNVRELPPHYRTARFWNRNREALSGYLSRPGEVRERFASVIELSDDLAEICRLLDIQLKNFRQELSLRYDVPIICNNPATVSA